MKNSEINEKSTLRMELINGEIYLLSSPKLHQGFWAACLLFNEYFTGKKCRVFLAPFDVHLKKGMKTPDVVQPDVLVACDLEDKVTERDGIWERRTWWLRFSPKARGTRI